MNKANTPLYPASYYSIPTGIDKEIFECIKKKYIDGNYEDSCISPEGKLDYNIRKSKNLWIATDHWISGMMKHFVEVANKSYFNYEIDKWSDKIQYTVYDQEDSHYSWHCDIANSHYSHNMIRKLSISLLLSDPDEYEGGEFQIMIMGDKDMKTMKPPMGTAIIFPSTTKHRVRPIKSGKRISLVGWMGGPPFR